ncbi:hypothetical protein BD770DRAFT_406907 [Pilaira anomala]|nr:hypothetical protein BD770DRAFT_406907 [Pilaira anomala]
MSSHSREPITLPYKADLVKKQVLLNHEVKNYIITQLIGTGAEQWYRPPLTEWVDLEGTQILYVADDVHNYPPIVIKIQEIVDEQFLHDTVSFCEKINQRYGAAPIILIFTINRIQDEIVLKTTRDPIDPFLLNLSSFPWANKCMFITKDSIQNHLSQKPLIPIVALEAFFISQKASIHSHSHKDDPTVQLLYRVSKDVMVAENTMTNDFLSLCDELETKLGNGMKELVETSSNTNKRTIDCLNESTELLKSYRIKYTLNNSEPASPILSSPSMSPISTTPATIPATTPAPISSIRNSQNWEFVAKYQQSLDDDEKRMNWKKCFAEGRRQGLFSNYSQPASLKNAYQRYNRQRRMES